MKKGTKGPLDLLPGKGRDFSKERDEEIIPLAISILRKLAAHDDLPIGGRADNAEKAAVFYQKFYREELVEELIERNVKVKDISYAFILATQALQGAMDVTVQSFHANKEIVVAKALGLDDLDDLRVKGLDEALKKHDV